MDKQEKISAAADIWGVIGHEQTIEELREACAQFFEMADANGDGTICVTELKNVLKEHLNRKYENLTNKFFREEAEHWISQHYDTDGDNRISLEEFTKNFETYWNSMQVVKMDLERQK